MRRLLALFILLAAPAWAATYYVDCAADPGGDGTTQATSGAHAAWDLVADVNGASFSAGDSILFKKACTWREQLTVPTSGSAGNSITFGAYGTGDNPIINGTDLIISGWSASGATITADPGANSDTCYVVPYWDAYGTDEMPFGNRYSDGAESENAGARFLNVAVPAGATITTATIDLTAIEDLSGTTVNATIVGERNVTPATFSTEDNYTGRTPTNATVEWNSVGAWTFWSTYTTPDIKTVIQEIVDLGSWASGNNLAIFIKNNASNMGAFRRACTYQNNTTKDPVLNITWQYPNVWQKALTTEPNMVFFDGVRGQKKGSAATCVAAGDWYWASNVLYVYSTSDPATAFTNPGVEAGARDYGILINAKAYLTVDGIDVWGANSNAGAGILIFTSANTITIKNCTVTYSAGCGIEAIWWGGGTGTFTGITFEGNTVHHNMLSGLSIGGGNGSNGATYTSSIISGNTVHHNSLDPSVAYISGIHVTNSGTDTTRNETNITVEQNLVYNEGLSDGGSRVANIYSGYGIWLDTTESCIVRHNRCYANASSGILVENGLDNEVYGNISYTNTAHTDSGNAAGITVGTSHETLVSTDNLVYNNTVYGNKTGLRCYGIGNYTDHETIIGTLFKNNISSGNTVNELSAEWGAENVHAATGWGSGNVYDHNCLGVEATAFVLWDASAKATYDAWETAYGGTTNSVETDPSFTNAAGGDFTLQAGSPCIDAGADLGDTYETALVPGSAWPSVVLTDSQYNAAREWVSVKINGEGAVYINGVLQGHGIGSVRLWDIGAYLYPSKTQTLIVLTPGN